MTDSKNRKYGALLSYVSIVLNTIIQLLYTPFLIKSLGQSEYGLYSLIYSIIGYLTILDLGFGNAIVVYTTKFRAQRKYNEEKKLHGMFFIVFIGIGLFAGILCLLLYFNVNNLFGTTMTSLEIDKAKVMMLLLTFNIVISFVFSIFSSIINAYEKFIYQKLISILSTILKPLIMIPLLLAGYKSISLVLVVTLLNVLVLLSNYIYCKRRLNVKIKYMGFDKKLFKIIFGYSIWIFMATIVDKINWSVDQFVLGAVSGTVAVSLYSVASQINSLFANLSTAISGVLLPKVSKMIAKKASDEELTKEFIKVGRIQFIIVYLMASGLVLFGKQFFIIWIGEKFIQSYYITLLLVLPLCIPLIQNLGISIMQAKNLHKFRSILYLFIAIVNVIISIPLAQKYGGIGSALGTGLSLLVGNGIIINIYYYKKVGINVIEFWKSIIPMLIIDLIPVLIIIILMNLCPLSGIKYMIVYIPVYSIIYFIINYFLVFNKYEKQILSNVKKKVSLRK